MKEEPLFNKDVKSLSMQELRKLSMQRMYWFRNCSLVHPGELAENMKNPLALQNVLFNIDPSTSIKLSIAYGMFPGVIQGMGTKRHFKFIQELLTGEVSFI